jgi:hypothetical protein
MARNVIHIFTWLCSSTEDTECTIMKLKGLFINYHRCKDLKHIFSSKLARNIHQTEKNK